MRVADSKRSTGATQSMRIRVLIHLLPSRIPIIVSQAMPRRARNFKPLGWIASCVNSDRDASERTHHRSSFVTWSSANHSRREASPTGKEIRKCRTARLAIVLCRNDCICLSFLSQTSWYSSVYAGSAISYGTPFRCPSNSPLRSPETSHCTAPHL